MSVDPKIGDRKIDADGVEYLWRGKMMGWRATGNHIPEHVNTPRAGELEGSRNRPDIHPTVAARLENEHKPRLETDSTKRKEYPVYSGPFRYFPDALAEIARLCHHGNDKHNPGQPLHWARSKSTDHLDCLARHLLEAGTVDTDGFYHDVKVAWRALSNLQVLMERVKGLPISPGSKE